jgi:hypothetical protein
MFTEDTAEIAAEVLTETTAEITAEVLAEATSGLGYRSQIWLIVPVVQTQ